VGVDPADAERVESRLLDQGQYLVVLGKPATDFDPDWL
jgi:hypothetical protein